MSAYPTLDAALNRVSRADPAAAIPAELKSYAQWVCWRLESREGNLTKPPYNAKTGRYGKSNDPATWCDFETALAAYQRGGYSGIGFAFRDGDGLTGLDLDHVIDPTTGVVDPRALEILDRFKGTYCEVSPSGTGLRIFCRGRPGRPGKNEGRVKWLEVYDYTSPRYLTVTGNHRQRTAATVTEQQAALDWLHTTYFTKPAASAATPRTAGVQVHLEDAILIEKACSASAALRSLWGGDTSAYGDDHSSADLALCSSLAFWTGRDGDRMDSLFRQSGLMREKWNREDYRQRTIAKAIAGCRDVYTGGGRGNGTAAESLKIVTSTPRPGGYTPSRDFPPQPDGEAVMSTANDTTRSAEPPERELPPIEAYGDFPPPAEGAASRIELPTLPRIAITLNDLIIQPPRPRFLIDGYLPKDVFALIGTGGAGKTTLWLMHYVHLILGLPLWDMEITESGPVVYVTAEDGEDRLKWRLFNIVDQMGLCRSDRQQIVDNLHIVNLVGTGRRLAALDSHGNIVITSLADQIIDEFQAIAPIITTFDPMVKFGPGERMVNDGEDAVINAALHIKESLHCAAGFSHHVSKDVMRNGIVDHHAGRGGSALGDGARAAYQLVTITEDLARNYPGAELYPDAIAAGDLLAYHITKLTDARKPMEPFILRRRGWLFDLVTMPTKRQVERAIEDARRERARQNVNTVVAYLKEHAYHKLTRRALEECYSDIGLHRNDTRAAISKGLREGVLIEAALPLDEQHGGKRTYVMIAGGAE